MRSIAKTIILAATVAALAALLLAGCQGEYKGSSLTPSKSGKGLQGDTVTKHPPIPYKSINTATLFFLTGVGYWCSFAENF